MSIAQGEVQPASGHSQVIDWSYDIQTREFECDQKGMMSAFGLKKPISGLDELLEHMLLGQQDAAREKIAQIERHGGHGNLSCCLMPNEAMLVHVDMSFERLNDHIVQGIVIPQLTITDSEELAKILETIFDLPNVGILIADQDTRILGCNRAFEQQMGYENRDIIGLKTNIFSSDHHSQAFYDDMWEQIDQAGYWSGNLLSRTSKGNHQAHHLCIYRLNFTSGRTLYLGVSTDISASLLWMKKVGEQTQQYSAFLPPREEFETQLGNLARENSNKDLSIVMALRPVSRKNGA